MRYLYTRRGNAQYGIRDLKFETFLVGRTWHGTASVRDDIAQIAIDRFPEQIMELSAEDYENVKKNETASTASFQTVSYDPTRPVHAQPAPEPENKASELLMIGETDE